MPKRQADEGCQDADLCQVFVSKVEGGRVRRGERREGEDDREQEGQEGRLEEARGRLWRQQQDRARQEQVCGRPRVQGSGARGHPRVLREGWRDAAREEGDLAHRRPVEGVEG